MKRSLLALVTVFISAATLYAQDEQSLTFKKDEVSGDSYYEEVVTAPNLKADELFKRAKTWILANMKTDDNNITFDEKEMTIVNAAAMKVDQKNFFTYAILDGIMDFKYHVWCKDGKYKLRVDNIGYHLLLGSGNDKTTKTESYNELKDNKYSRHLKSQAEEKLWGLVTVFKKAMESEAKQDKKDW